MQAEGLFRGDTNQGGGDTNQSGHVRKCLVMTLTKMAGIAKCFIEHEPRLSVLMYSCRWRPFDQLTKFVQVLETE